MKRFPGIFNDVIGPVMRGPSSSHTAASWRAAAMSMQVLNEPLKTALIEFDRHGAWAPNYREQGTTLGIDGGLLGLDMTDDRIKNTEAIADAAGISIRYEISDFKTKHVNTVRLSLEGESGKKVQILAASLGGGAVEIQSINGFDLTINGGFYELLLIIDKAKTVPIELEALLADSCEKMAVNSGNRQMINYKFSSEIPSQNLLSLRELSGFYEIFLIDPVLPVVSGKEKPCPFDSVISLLEYAEKEDLDLGDLGLIYEKSQSGLESDTVVEKMKELVKLIENSIDTGLAGTTYKDRILPQQSHLIDAASKRNQILQNSIVNKIITYVSAIMESKSAMEVVVANPTAGSCGAVGGVLRAVAEEIEADEKELIKAYFAAGMVGAFFAMGPGFSAEEHGCQVECGASAGMAAAGITQLFGGTAQQGVDAASMAIQNMIGLVCDPIADRVEAPCLGKNVSAAVNALSSATMVCAGFNALIPLNEVIETVSSVSKQMPTCVKCTGKGGLAMTKTALDLKERMKLSSCSKSCSE